jgi:hypothetical protein
VRGVGVNAPLRACGHRERKEHDDRADKNPRPHFDTTFNSMFRAVPPRGTTTRPV